MWTHVEGFEGLRNLLLNTAHSLPSSTPSPASGQFAAQVLSLLPSTSPSCPANCRLRPSLLWEESQADPGVGRNLSRENTKAERGRPCRGFPAGEDPGPGPLGPVSGALGERNPRLCSRPLGTSGARSPVPASGAEPQLNRDRSPF